MVKLSQSPMSKYATRVSYESSRKFTENSSKGSIQLN
ncbi:hypothetical protein Fuma_05055 [Fuerstiella marisgermanici]|uniref:Uncharacterized protein n=1 Tax=Fuerstiella marisgermanici TaxID=1891926 RepID=A0A1P8WMZ0_9PLAN|nr:hypothetical protein Fuma_05055 [Fuerstiella marisgermanici]